jgi:hypothetical protein
MSPSRCSECCRMTSKITTSTRSSPAVLPGNVFFHRRAFNVCSVRAMQG